MHSSLPARIRARWAAFGLSMLSAAAIGLAPTPARAAYEAASMLDWRTLTATVSSGDFEWVPGSFQSHVQVFHPDGKASAADWTSELSVFNENGQDTESARILAYQDGGTSLNVAASALESPKIQWATAHRMARFTLDAGANINFTIQGWLHTSHSSYYTEALLLMEVLDPATKRLQAYGIDRMTSPSSEDSTIGLTFVNLGNTRATYLLDVSAQAFAHIGPPVPEAGSLAMALGGLIVIGAVSLRGRPLSS